MDKAEKAAAIANDPVPKLRARLIAEGIASEAELAAIEAQVEADLDDAVEFALASAYPALSEMKRDVYATEIA
jgi:pyruvate dehydrogenase E1 component alpha subunit